LLPSQTNETVNFNVGMTCEGCANACKRILGKLDGVGMVEANVDEKRVTVYSDGTTPKEKMLEALQTWSASSGKPVALA
jgi:copper chaperone